MTALLETVLTQVSQLPDTEQDAVAARLLQTLTEFQQEQKQTGQKPRPQFGSAKGMGYMREDFEEPLEEFKEYTGSISFSTRTYFFGSSSPIFS